MTIPRELNLEKIGEKYFITSQPLPQLSISNEKVINLKNLDATNFNLTERTGKITGPVKLQITSDKLESFSLTFSNNLLEKIVVGFDKKSINYFIDRRQTGKVDFEKDFAERHTAPRLSDNDQSDLILIVDNSSIELFADKGLSVMTEIFFPNQIYSTVQIQSPANFTIKSLQLTRLKSIWK